MSILDALSQAGGALGTLGAGVAGWVATKIREVQLAAEKVEQVAEKAEAARVFVEAALARFRSELEALDALKRGIRLEIEGAKHYEGGSPYRSGSSPFLAPLEPGAPSNGELSRRIEAIERRLEELRQDIMRERGARHAMQHQLADDDREDERQWREIHAGLGEIKGYLRTLPLPPRER